MTDQQESFDQLLDLIEGIRQEQYACSNRDVATRLKMSTTSTARLLSRARKAGAVDWADRVGGSIHTTRMTKPTLGLALDAAGPDGIQPCEVSALTATD